MRLKAWQLPLIVVVVVCGLIAGLRYWRGQSLSVESLLRRMPGSVTTVAYVDVDGLGRAGILGQIVGPASGREPDYLRFVEESGFDYQRDLRSALIGFDADSTYVIGTGTFDWQGFRNYAESRNGICRFSVCRMPAYGRNRAISWGPLRADIVAFASGPDQWGAITVINGEETARDWIQTTDPVWVLTTGQVLRSWADLPAGARTFTGILEPATRILFSLGAGAAGGFELRLRADVPQAADATRMAAELTQSTVTLNAMLARENRHPNPADLSGVLAGGAFQAQATQVSGTWPVPRPLIDSLMASGQ